MERLISLPTISLPLAVEDLESDLSKISMLGTPVPLTSMTLS
jgi:hypothetical protein